MQNNNNIIFLRSKQATSMDYTVAIVQVVVIFRNIFTPTSFKLISKSQHLFLALSLLKWTNMSRVSLVCKLVKAKTIIIYTVVLLKTCIVGQYK